MEEAHDNQTEAGEDVAGSLDSVIEKNTDEASPPVSDAEVSAIESDGDDVESDDEVHLPDKEIHTPEAQLVPISDIQEKTNIRQSMRRIEDLAESIRVNGLLQPIVIRRTPQGADHDKPYEMVVGYRRKMAFTHLEKPEIPASIIDVEDADILADIIVENAQRENHSPVEEARIMKQLLDTNGWTHGMVAAHLGVHRTQVTKRLSLLDMPTEVIDWVDEGKLTASHAEVIAGLETTEDQLEVAELAVRTEAPVTKLNSWTQKIKEEQIATADETIETVDSSTPLEVLLPQDATPLPRLDVHEHLSEADIHAAQLYILLRNGNDVEMLEYLEEHFGISYEDLWEWIERLTPEQVDNQLDVMTRRWLMAAHRFPTFPEEMRDRFGTEGSIGPVPVEMPEDIAAIDEEDFDEGEYDFDDFDYPEDEF